MNNNEETTVPEKLYHYTSKDGFLGIIENKTFWASEILYMNDEIVKLDTGLENRKLKKVRFRKDIFVPYCELQIEKEKIPREEPEGKYPWLGDITVGHNTTDIFYDSILHACSVYGIGFGRVLEREPRKSDIPYRG